MSLDFYLTENGEEVFSRNITHNLGRMADAAGIYKCLWRPDENGITKASQCIEPLKAGLLLLVTDPATVLALCDEIERLQDLLGKANALCRIRADEIERLRKDAARYQLLKSKYTTENDHGELRIEFECGFDHYNDIDAAIDAAMESKT